MEVFPETSWVSLLSGAVRKSLFEVLDEVAPSSLLAPEMGISSFDDMLNFFF